MPTHHRDILGTATGHIEPRQKAVWRIRQTFLCLEINHTIHRAQSKARQGIDGDAVPIHSAKAFVPAVGVVAEDARDEGLPVVAAQGLLGFPGKLQRLCQGPLGQDPGVDNEKTVFMDGQWPMPKPGDKFLAVRRAEYPIERVTFPRFAHTGRYRKKVKIVIAKHRFGPAFPDERAHLPQRYRGIRTTIHQITDKTESGVTGQLYEQPVERLGAAL